MRTIRRLAALAVAVALVVPALMLPAAAVAQQTPEAYLEMLRSDLRTGKVELLTDALELTPAQGEKFWPIYRQYDQEMAAIGDRQVALIKNFADNYGRLSDADAALMAKEWFSMQSDYLKSLKKAHAKVAKELSPKLAAQFVQVENTINMMIRLQVAAELPLLE